MKANPKQGSQEKDGAMLDNTQPTDVVGLDDKRVETSNYERYKGRAGVTDRLAIVSSGLIRAESFYYERGSDKKKFRAPKDQETLEFVKKQLGEPNQAFGMVLFHYRTDENGDIVELSKCSGKFKTWVISDTRYGELSAIHRKWPLLDAGLEAPQHDLIVKCTEERFQRMQFSPDLAAHWKRKPEWYKAVKAKEPKVVEKVQLALGRTLSKEEIMTLLGVTLPSQTGSTDNAGDIDLSDVIGDDLTA
jgi:hypothetical protein